MKNKFPILLTVSLIFLAACVREKPAATEIPEAETPSASEESPSVSPPLFTSESIARGEEGAYSILSSAGEEYRYLIYFPEDYVESEQWPLILFLHGSGARGNDIEGLRGRTVLRWTDADMDFPFIVVSPQIPSGFWPEYNDMLDELLDHLMSRLPIDENALFLTGNSLGGHGSWHYAIADPERFAAVAIISGGPTIAIGEAFPEDFCKLKEVPIWVFHGDADNIVPIEKNVFAVQALEECGSDSVSFTIYEGGGHVAASRFTYSDAALYEWLLAQIQ